MDHPGPPLPRPRGPLSEVVVDALRREPGPVVPLGAIDVTFPLDDDDLHLALYCLYELHYRGFAAIDDGWEWQPDLLALRSRLERVFEAGLRAAVGAPAAPDDVRAALVDITTSGDGPSLSGHMSEVGTWEQMQEFCIHRSAYQLKEADPHTWGLPRLAGRPKAAMVAIQADEYGQGVAPDMHAELFALTMAELGLDPTYGAYLDHLPGVSLATVNLVTMFGLHRRLRGALVGHLAVFEMTSEGPMGRYAEGLTRLGAPPPARRFYAVHVEADAVHRHIALDDMVATLVEDQPHLAADVVFGARALTLVERRFTENLLGSWAAGRSSLLGPAALLGPPARSDA